MKILPFLSIFSTLIPHSLQKDCDAKWMYQYNLNVTTSIANSTVCACNLSYCDDFTINQPPTTLNQVLQVTSTQWPDNSQNPKRFYQENYSLSSNKTLSFTNFTITNNERQDILGFGGAMTDSSAILISNMTADMQDLILQQHFDPVVGNGYTLIRTNMGGCDFSLRPYTYVEQEGDYDCNTFQLAPEDLELKIPMYKKINQLSENKVQYYFAPWTAPSWMKTNDSPIGKGSIINDPKYYKAWAKYFIKFIKAYKSYGLDFQHFSLQNEPGAGYYNEHRWQETGWNATGENMFLLNYLLPELISNGITDKIIQVMDGQRVDLARNYPQDALAGAENYLGQVAGFATAIHWYWDFVIDRFITSGYFLTKTYNSMKPTFGENFYILNTEACMPVWSYPDNRDAWKDLGNWHHGERYSQDILTDLNNYVAGWTDWNIVLDPSGGPNWVGNRHDAGFIVDIPNDTVYKNPIFYHMGHFSKFLDNSFKILNVKSSRQNDEKVQFIAATNGSKDVYILLNSAEIDLSVAITARNGMRLERNIARKSIQTFVVKV